MSQNCTRSHECEGSLTLPYPVWHGYACSPVSGAAWVRVLSRIWCGTDAHALLYPVAWIRVLSRIRRGMDTRAFPYPTWHGTSGEKGKSQVAILSGVLRVGTFEIWGV